MDVEEVALDSAVEVVEEVEVVDSEAEVVVAEEEEAVEIEEVTEVEADSEQETKMEKLPLDKEVRQKILWATKIKLKRKQAMTIHLPPRCTRMTLWELEDL